MAWPKGVPRGPKKPREEIDVEAEEIDPANIKRDESGETVEDTGPTAPKPKKARSKKSFDVDGVESLLLSIHLSLSALTGVRELAIDVSEAKALAGAAANVARHYDMPELPQKMIDWANLIIACAVVYGPRVVAIKARAPKKVVPIKPENDKVAPHVIIPSSGPNFGFSPAGPIAPNNH